MIHYHGTPITPLGVATSLLTGRHAFVSYERPDQVALVADACQSFAFDCGAFSVWRQRQLGLTRDELDVEGYAAWVNEWRRHPGFDFAIIPDVIDGDEAANDMMFARWHQAGGELLRDVPVWHMHESLDRLKRLCTHWPRVALGSSGEWATVGTAGWWARMGDALDFICDADGRPPCKLHGLRMLNKDVFSKLPLASADSTNVARNGQRAGDTYRVSNSVGALILADRIESEASAPRWVREPADQQHEQYGLDGVLI